MQLVVAVMCALLAAAEAPPIIKDIPPVDNIIKHYKSGKLMPEDVAPMMQRMGLTDTIDFKRKLDDDMLQKVMAFMPDHGGLPSVHDLKEQLRSGNLSRTDYMNMTRRMSPPYLLTLVQHVYQALLPQGNKRLQSLPEAASDAEDVLVRCAPRENDSAINETNEKPDQNQLPLYLWLGVALLLNVVLAALLFRRYYRDWQTADDKPLFMKEQDCCRCRCELLPKQQFTTVADGWSCSSSLDSAHPSVDQCDTLEEEPATAGAVSAPGA